MNYESLTGKNIQQSFEEYHQLNPTVYQEFKTLAFKAIMNGKRKISFKMIMNVIRWDVFIKTNDPTLFTLDGKIRNLKINDAYGSRYARLFIKDFPEHADKIELRRLRS